MRLVIPLAFAVGVLLGGGAAFALRPDGTEDAEARTDRKLFRQERRARPRTIRRDDLRTRLAELEKRLAETRRRTAAAIEPMLEAARKPFDSSALLDYQREHDPEAYAHRTNSIIQYAIQQVKSREENLDLLASVDASRWDPAARAAFEEYVELSDYIAQYEAKLAELRILDPELPPGFGYDGISEEISRMFELQCDVRYRLMAEAAKQYGLSEEDAMDLADVSHRVTESTLSYKALREERERNEARHRRLEEEAAAAANGGVQ